MAFLFTDIVGSTAKWERHPDAMPDAIRRHDHLLSTVVDHHCGSILHWAGDGLIASFGTAAEAADAAVDAQRRLRSGSWSSTDGLGVRMGVHHGPVVLRDGEPNGWALNFGARFTDVGGAGQILISQSAIDAIGRDESRSSDYRAIPLATIRLRDIAEAAVLYQLQAPDLPSEFPPLRDTGAPTPLPTPPTSLIGRDDDLDALRRVLSGNRLVTLIGPPGVGKSRLAAELANGMMPHFPAGVARVDVSSAGGDDLAEPLSTVLGVSGRGNRTALEAVVDWLAGRKFILVLDQCDTSPVASSQLASTIVAAAPGVTVITTGRAALGTPGELVHHLGPLALDDAVTLVETRSTGPVADDEPEVLAALVDRLDRLPLALELAAASASVYSWSEMLTALDDRAEKHIDSPMRPVASTIALAFDRLDPALRAMLTAAGAFTGPFGRDAFAAVCAPESDPAQAAAGLAALVDRSLIVAGGGAQPTRFRLLHAVHDVVTDRGSTATREDAERRLVEWVTGFVADAAAGLRGADERVWSQRVSSQFGNLRAAFERSLAGGNVAAAATISTELWDYGFMRFNEEYFTWSDRLIEEFPDGDPVVLGPVFGTAALSAWIRDDADRAIALAGRALELERSEGSTFDLPARLALINAAVYSGAAAPPMDVYAQAADYQRNQPEAYFRVNVDTQNAMMATWRGDLGSARRRAVRAVRTARESGNPSTMSYALWALGSALADDDPLHAEACLGQALEIARETGNRWLTALSQMSLASLRRRTESAIDSAIILADLLDLLVRAGHRTHLWSTLRLCVPVLAELGEDELAIAVAAWLREVGLAMPALPADERAFALFEQQVAETGDEAWVARAELESATWTADTAAVLARDALLRHLPVGTDGQEAAR